jgi:iron complex transport system substrate-binding protein
MRAIIQTRKAAAAFAAIFMLLHAIAAFAQASPQSSDNAPAFREFVDDTGRTVRVPQPVRRIVSLAPSLTETIYALGLQDKLVGDTDFCDFPPDAKRKTKVGGTVNPSLEKIASLHPDLVLVTKVLNRLETVHSLDTLGIPSYATDAVTVDEIISSTRRLAEVLGSADTGTALAADMRQRLTVVKERLANRRPRRILFVVWTQPLITAGSHTFLADALRQAGATSIVDSSQNWPQVSLEEVVHQQPEFLVFAPAHSEETFSFDKLAELPGWNLLEAVRNRRFIAISDSVNRPAPRIVDAIEDLAKQLHPEAFAEKPDSPKPGSNKSQVSAAYGPVRPRYGHLLASCALGGNPCAL